MFIDKCIIQIKTGTILVTKTESNWGKGARKVCKELDQSWNIVKKNGPNWVQVLVGFVTKWTKLMNRCS